MDFEELRQVIKDSALNTAVYVGADSKVYKDYVSGLFMVVYVGVVVIHHGGKHGASIYKVIYDEPYPGKVKDRLMREIGITTEIAVELIEAIGPRSFEIHMDINPNEQYLSSQVVKMATGWVMGMFQQSPKIKPDAFAASTVADRFAVKLAQNKGRQSKRARKKGKKSSSVS